MKLLKRIGIGLALLYALACGLMYFAQDFIIFHPYTLAKDYEFTFARAHEEWTIPMSDGTKLCAIHFTVDRPKGVVLFWHGNTGNVEICSPMASHFINRGYSAVVVDYRSFGKSEGKPSQETLYSDGLEVYDWVAEQYKEEDIILYGQSLGSGVAVYTASQRQPKALVLEAPYYSIAELGKEQYGFLPVGLLAKYPMPSHLYIDSIQCPISILHGTDDETIPIDHGRRLAAENVRAKFIALQGGGHNGCPLFQEYQDELDEVLLGYVRADQTPIDVKRRKKKIPPLPVRVDSLKAYFDRTASPQADAAWLDYFKEFPRTYGEFESIYGDGDSTRIELLEEEASLHLHSFFDAIRSHRQVEPTSLFIDLAVGAKEKTIARDVLQSHVRSHFLENDSLVVMELSERTEGEKGKFWSFYLDGLLITDAIEIDLINRLVSDEKQKAIVEEILTEVHGKEGEIEVVSDTLEALHDTLDQ